MTAPPGPARGRGSGRRRGDSGTREAILAAARARFGEAGYDRATIRQIASDAGVDPALVHHFFGTKERLFAAVMRLPVAPSDVLDQVLGHQGTGPDQAGPEAQDGLGVHMLRTVLGVWDQEEMRAAFLGLLRTAVTSDEAAAMLREFATVALLGRVARAVQRDDDPEFRAALVASQVLGLALTRYVLQLDPLTRASNDQLAAAIGPTLDRYLTAPLLTPADAKPADAKPADAKPANP
ncbi:MAG TPA: TetR family transcriptional regulator [Streptosporangiaceae bacterium]|nr:TetR family transcriptional regulator [Streptosporangiaceae bacterium]